ncbi:MAG TPA: hypothetical protein VNL96_03565 [Gemmatimonadaceae bacterium]|nr:hypothetical protein [Gemmatimonadaceae bacterium]
MNCGFGLRLAFFAGAFFAALRTGFRALAAFFAFFLAAIVLSWIEVEAFSLRA